MSLVSRLFGQPQCGRKVTLGSEKLTIAIVELTVSVTTKKIDHSLTCYIVIQILMGDCWNLVLGLKVHVVQTFNPTLLVEVEETT